MQFFLLLILFVTSCQEGVITTERDSSSASNSNQNSQETPVSELADVTPEFNGNIYKILMAPDNSGSFYVVGDFTQYRGVTVPRIVKLYKNYRQDTNFAPPATFNGTLKDVLVLPDGDVIVAGNFTNYNSTTVNGIVRLNSDGSMDATTGFNTNIGTGIGGFFSTNAITVNLSDDGNNYICVMGSWSSYNSDTSTQRFTCLNNDGTMLAAFDATSGFDANNMNVAVNSGEHLGNYFTVGQSVSYNSGAVNFLSKINSNATADAPFLASAGAGSDQLLVAVARTKTGSRKIYIGGNVSTYGGVGTPSRFTRVNVDGSNDATYAGDNLNVMPLDFCEGDNGKGEIYLGGRFTDIGGTGINHIAKLDSSGALDTSFFAATEGTDNDVYTITESNDGSGRIFFGGIFTTVNGVTSNYFGVKKIIGANNTRAYVTKVQSVTTDGSYTTGQTISIKVTFSEAVDVNTTGGTPFLRLFVGATNNYQDASYVSGDLTKELVFNYTIQAGDIVGDLDYLNANALILNSGSITTVSSSEDANLRLPGIGYNNSLAQTSAIDVN